MSKKKKNLKEHAKKSDTKKLDFEKFIRTFIIYEFKRILRKM